MSPDDEIKRLKELGADGGVYKGKEYGPGFWREENAGEVYDPPWRLRLPRWPEPTDEMKRRLAHEAHRLRQRNLAGWKRISLEKLTAAAQPLPEGYREPWIWIGRESEGRLCSTCWSRPATVHRLCQPCFKNLPRPENGTGNPAPAV